MGETEKTLKKNTMTKECIFTALLILMEKKPYEEITITDIAKKAGVSRMSYYMITPQLLLIPGLLGCVENRKRKNILTALVGIVCLGYFLWFLKTASGSGMRVLPYKTWIFTDKEWINGADFF